MAFNPRAIFTSMNEAVINPVDKSMGIIISNLSSALATPTKLMAIILIVFYDYRLILGKGVLSASDFVAIICKIAIVTMLVTKAGDFKFYIKELFFDKLPNELSQIVASSEPVKANAFDKIAYTTLNKLNQLTEPYSSLRLDIHIPAYFILFIVVIFCIIGFTVQAIAQIGLALVIALGPMFIAFYMWETTKKFTEAWLAQAANFIILQVLVVTLATILAEVFNQFLSVDWQKIMLLFVPAIVISVVGGFLLLMLPSIASALAGGGASLSSALTPAGWMGKGAKSGGKALWNKMRGNKT